MSILIILPLEKERVAFLAFCHEQSLRQEPVQLGQLQAVHVPKLDVTLALGGLGKAQCALQTQHLLDQQAWEAVICAGAAGGLADGVAPGHVVVAQETVEHDFRNGFSSRPRPRFPGADGLVQGLRSIAASQPFPVHFGTIASGDEDIVSAERRAALHRQTAALAVAWEGAGVARAASFSRVPFVELRGITDGADREASQHFKQNLTRSIGNVAALILSWQGQKL